MAFRTSVNMLKSTAWLGSSALKRSVAVSEAWRIVVVNQKVFVCLCVFFFVSCRILCGIASALRVASAVIA